MSTSAPAAAAAGNGSASNLPDFLKPFHERASLAEDRLAKLEAALEVSLSKGKSSNGPSDFLSSLVELREKLEKAKAEFSAEREQSRKEQERLAVENAKLQYRISHLVRSLEEADKLLEKATTSP